MTERCELSDNDEAAKQSTTSLQINNWCENEDNSTLDNTKQGTEEANDIEYCLELIPNLNDDAHSLIIEGTSQTKHENRIENLAANNVGAIHIGDRIYVNGDAEFTGNIGGSIYQKRLRESLENRSDCTKKDHEPPKRSTKCAILTLISFFMLSLLITVVVVLIVRHTILKESFTVQPTNPNTTEFIFSHPVYSKSNWGGLAEKGQLNPLSNNISLVIISHSYTKECHNFTECAETVQKIQHKFFKKDFDIGYNFLIGLEGGIYVGRGWTNENHLRSKSLNICFIGDFNQIELSKRASEAGKDLIKYGLSEGKISDDFRLVGERQTSPLLFGPGVNVAKEIAKWPNFYEGSVL
ncbi:peptidoglycan-recognition protein LA-like isoform X3 [Sitophilus oryzae]|uniref:Peptidoglycan-recognition protein LA-like isoform X3 n=1 Tax=Sitophilus oryzae TaxID=7048 RepID=A0A6J2YH61_SITOR|nr:peptidoglycan-recognition protein LA-like isoform X3 [Sitophilus oryzae]